jgi:hypothetical protein
MIKREIETILLPFQVKTATFFFNEANMIDLFYAVAEEGL